MQLQHVLYFLAVAENGSFTAAAGMCSVAQPSLSNGIRDLEASLGAPLFMREKGRRGAVLTDLGSAIRPHFLRIAQSIAKAERQAADYSANSNRAR